MIKKILFIWLLLSLIGGIFIYLTLKYLSDNTGTELLYFPQQIYHSLQSPSLKPGFNLVVLGLDPRNDALEKTDTTDTIVIGRLNQNWHLNLISIPRDLWIYSLNSKINQIYPLSLKKDSWNSSAKYITDNFGQITGQQIDRVLIITTANLIKLTNLLGGVDVNLPQGYTDTQYPNPVYIQNPSPKIPIYITVSFKKGLNHLDNSNITEYVRSRKGHNDDGTESTDLGRIIRQQALIDALIAKIKSPQFLENPQHFFNLYRFWHNDLQTNLTDQDLISLALSTQGHIPNLTINKTTVPSGENSQIDIIYHPPTFINPQWVFIPANRNYQAFQKFIDNFLSQ